MVEEPTVEELKAKLELLKKQSLEREIALAQAEADKAEQLKKKEAEEQLREEIRNEERENIIKQMGEQSNIEADNKDETVNLSESEKQQVRDFYAKTPLQSVPGNSGTRAVFDEDTAFFKRMVESEVERMGLSKKYKDREIKGLKYEDKIKSISQSYVNPKPKVV